MPTFSVCHLRCSWSGVSYYTVLHVWGTGVCVWCVCFIHKHTVHTSIWITQKRSNHSRLNWLDGEHSCATASTANIGSTLAHGWRCWPIIEAKSCCRRRVYKLCCAQNINSMLVKRPQTLSQYWISVLWRNIGERQFFAAGAYLLFSLVLWCNKAGIPK